MAWSRTTIGLLGLLLLLQVHELLLLLLLLLLQVLELLLRVLDEGQLIDSMGRKACFRNAIVIFTISQQQQELRQQRQQQRGANPASLANGPPQQQPGGEPGSPTGVPVAGAPIPQQDIISHATAGMYGGRGGAAMAGSLVAAAATMDEVTDHETTMPPLPPRLAPPGLLLPDAALELMGSVDCVAYFRPLQPQHLAQLVQVQLLQVRRGLGFRALNGAGAAAAGGEGR